MLSAVVYGRGLAISAPTATEDDVQAHAIRLTNQRSPDPLGLILPLFQHGTGNVWLAPVPVYATATVMTLVPSASFHGRWAALCFGAIDVTLLYALVVRCFGRQVLGVSAALLLLVTPSHFVISRTASPEGIWPLPFLLGWALGLTALADRPDSGSRWIFAIGTASLVGSAYAQPSAVLLVPLLAVVTIHIYRRADGWRPADAIPALAMTILAVLPALVWCLRFPSAEVIAFARWLLEPADARSMFRAATVSKAFWDFFLPSHLFFSPAAPGLCGMFLTATAVPIAVGSYVLVQSTSVEQRVFDRLQPAIIAVCIMGPLVSVLANQPLSDGRGLVIVPFGVLLAALGATTIDLLNRVIGRVVLCIVWLSAAFQALVCLGYLA